MSQVPMRSGQRVRLTLIFALPFIVFVAFFWLEELSRGPHLSVGMERSEVYDLMGEPSNPDDEMIAMWSSDGSSGKPWRHLYGKGGWIVVFGSDGRTITHSVGLSALNIDSSMTDEEVAAQILGITNF